jgi:ABC-type Fe3+-siderophore transport system permease subunit
MSSAMPAGALLAAAAMLAAHVAGVLLGYGPPEMAVDPELAVLWVVRAALVWLAAPAVWFAARVYDGHATPTSFWLAGLATALVGAVVAAVVVPAREIGPRS